MKKRLKILLRLATMQCKYCQCSNDVTKNYLFNMIESIREQIIALFQSKGVIRLIFEYQTIFINLFLLYSIQDIALVRVRRLKY